MCLCCLQTYHLLAVMAGMIGDDDYPVMVNAPSSQGQLREKHRVRLTRRSDIQL